MLQVAFLEGAEESVQRVFLFVDTAVDCFFFMDVVLQFFVAIKDQYGTWVYSYRYAKCELAAFWLLDTALPN